MKTTKFIIAMGILGLGLASCKSTDDVQTTVVDFENVTLNSDNIWNGSDLSGKFISGISTFNNSYNASWESWSGFACSAKIDSVTTGYSNQYSVIAGSGALNSKKFALVYDSAAVSIPKTTDYYAIKSLYITNSTWAYRDIRNGSAFSKKFVSGDWFKIILKGYKSNVQTGSIDIYLADFRNGKSDILKTWKKIDVSSLGQIDLLTFTFDSTDKGSFGINTPIYACIDNIEFS
jgi:hypothetical protein